MDEFRIHADRRTRALVHGGALQWVPSPEAGVERRMLERSGGEVAMASTIVRYQKGSRFPRHIHALGEEFLVLQGTFSDESGHYPTGSYVRNPPGSAHAPYSENGCTIFVKLRQMDDDEAEQVRLRPADRVWLTQSDYGRERATLYSNGRIHVTLERLAKGAELSLRPEDGGVELFVVWGSIQLQDVERTRLESWSWLREPSSETALTSASEALLWVKRGHLR